MLLRLAPWWWERGEQRFARDRWPDVASVETALREEDPWLAAQAILLLAELDPAQAAPLARDLTALPRRKGDLEELAANQATQALWRTAWRLPLKELLALDDGQRLYGVDVEKVLREVPPGERVALLSTLLERQLAYGTLAYHLRELLALAHCTEPEALELLARAAREDAHPAQARALEWLFRANTPLTLAPLARYLEEGGEKPAARSAGIAAAARLGPETAERLLAPLAGEGALPADRAACFDALAQALKRKLLPRDDPAWLERGLAALETRGAVAEAATRMLDAMLPRAVKAAAKRRAGGRLRGP